MCALTEQTRPAGCPSTCTKKIHFSCRHRHGGTTPGALARRIRASPKKTLPVFTPGRTKPQGKRKKKNTRAAAAGWDRDPMPKEGIVGRWMPAAVARPSTCWLSWRRPRPNRFFSALSWGFVGLLMLAAGWALSKWAWAGWAWLHRPADDALRVARARHLRDPRSRWGGALAKGAEPREQGTWCGKFSHGTGVHWAIE